MKHRKVLWESCILMLSFWAGWQALEGAKGLQPGSGSAPPYVKGAGYVHVGGQVGVQPRNPGAGTALAGKPAVSYAKLPLSFEANQGQTDKTVRFLSHGRGYGLFLTGDEAVLEVQESGARSQDSGRPLAAARGLHRTIGNGPQTTDHGRRTTSDILRLKLLDANQSSAVVGLNELPGKVNYFLGNDPRKWRTNAPTYAQVKYRNVYPGIDLVYYGNQAGELESDFVVAPGADPGAIALAVGAGLVPAQGRAQWSRLRIARDGELVIPTEGGEIRFRKPLVYQESESEVRSQKSGAKNENRNLKFEIRNSKREIRNARDETRESKIEKRRSARPRRICEV